MLRGVALAALLGLALGHPGPEEVGDPAYFLPYRPTNFQKMEIRTTYENQEEFKFEPENREEREEYREEPKPEIKYETAVKYEKPPPEEEYQPPKGEYEPPKIPQGEYEPPPYRPPKEEPPKEEYQPTQEEYQPPKEEYQPPKEEYRPPKEEYQPPKEEYRPPREEYQPPKEEHQPPREEYQPPKEEYQPPREEYQPPKEETRPPIEPRAESQPPPPKEDSKPMEEVKQPEVPQELQSRLASLDESIAEIDSMMNKQTSEIREIASGTASKETEEKLMAKFRAEIARLVNFPTNPADTRRFSCKCKIKNIQLLNFILINSLECSSIHWRVLYKR